MTMKEHKTKLALAETLVSGDPTLLKGLLREALQDVLEGEMSECLGAEPGERTTQRQRYRSGYASRSLEEDYPYLSLDARYEKVREDGVVQSQAILVAIGIHGEGKRQILVVELAQRESRSSWKDLLLRLKERGLSGVEFVVSDDHAGLERAVGEVLTVAAGQRGYVHFLRNALDYLPRKADDDGLQELRWLYDRRDHQKAQRDLSAWIGKGSGRYPKLVDWVEQNIGETLTFYRLPRQHHKHLKSTNRLERLDEEIKRRTRVVRIFPNAASCLRLIRALCVETHAAWLKTAAT